MPRVLESQYHFSLRSSWRSQSKFKRLNPQANYERRGEGGGQTEHFSRFRKRGRLRACFSGEEGAVCGAARGSSIEVTLKIDVHIRAALERKKERARVERVLKVRRRAARKVTLRPKALAELATEEFAENAKSGKCVDYLWACGIDS